MATLREVFWAKVDKESGPIHPTLGRCWPWKGHRVKGQYGDFAYPLPNGKRKHQAAHRVAWVLTNGRRVAAGKEICHRCDYPPCCNPDHLVEGTHSENERDKVAKGRNVTRFGVVGENSLRAKITDAQALEIRAKALDPAVRLEALGAEYGLSHSGIRDVVIGRSFGHLPVTQPPRRAYVRRPLPPQTVKVQMMRIQLRGRTAKQIARSAALAAVRAAIAEVRLARRKARVLTKQSGAV